MKDGVQRSPKGKLLAIGGNEVKGPEKGDQKNQQLREFHSGVLTEFVRNNGGDKTRIEIIPVASELQEEVGQDYLSAFSKLGISNAGVIFLKEREDSNRQKVIERISRAGAVIFSGGDQVKLIRKIKGTRLDDILKERYLEDENFILAGTSAGAMAMAEHMICEGNSGEPLLKGIVEMETGMEFLKSVIIDTHSLNRDRLARLVEALLKNPQALAIGISEDTGLLINEGNHCTAIGSGGVLIIDAGAKGLTNYEEIEQRQPVFVENLRLSFLAKGSAFLLKERKMIKF